MVMGSYLNSINCKTLRDHGQAYPYLNSFQFTFPKDKADSSTHRTLLKVSFGYRSQTKPERKRHLGRPRHRWRPMLEWTLEKQVGNVGIGCIGSE
jgi:hypothetical protein